MTFAELPYSDALLLQKELVGGFRAPDNSIFKVWTIKSKPHLLIEFKGKCYKASYVEELNEFMESLSPVEDKNAEDADHLDPDPKGRGEDN